MVIFEEATGVAFPYPLPWPLYETLTIASDMSLIAGDTICQKQLPWQKVIF